MLASLGSQNWGMFVLRGALALVLGALALLVPGPTLAALILVFAVYAVLDGIVAIGVGLGAGHHPEPAAYRAKFVGRYEHRLIEGGVGHNLPQEAPGAFAQAILGVAGV